MATPAEQDMVGGEAPVPAPVQLTMEELKVLKECRFNSIVYRGIPMALIGVATAKFVTNAGHFRKYSGLFYTGLVSLGFLGGIGSYRNTCISKILALKDSRLADDLRELQRRAGHPVNERAETEFDHQHADSDNVATETPVTQPFDSPLNKQSEDGGNRWDEIRRQSRQVHSSTPGGGEMGRSFEDLRRRHRSNQGNSNSLEPEEEEDLERKKDLSSSPEMASFRSQQFESDRPSALDFSKSDETGSLTFPDHDDNVESREVKRRNHRKGVTRKNQYGDDME